MKRWIIIAAVAAVLLVAALATRGFGLFATPPTALTLYGNIDVRQVDLAFRVPGRIAAMNVDEGDRVAAGQELARLDQVTASREAELAFFLSDAFGATLAAAGGRLGRLSAQ